MRIETTVREAGFGHHTGDANTVWPIRTDSLGGRLQHLDARLLFVLVVVAHGLVALFI